MVAFIVILVIIIVLLLLYVVGVQNKLVVVSESVDNSFSQIGVNQQSRFDALTQLANATAAYSEHEKETLLGVIEKRQPSTSVESVEKNEDIISEVLSRLSVVVENYPDLKASETYKETMQSINDYENKVRVAKMVYNDSVTKYNRLVKQFPSSVVASMLKYTSKEYLKTEDQKKDMPDLNFKSTENSSNNTNTENTGNTDNTQGNE